jgi:thymidylate synthase ThyX
MKIELIKYPSAEDWMLCKQCALVTVGKNAITEPNIKWKHDILEARHSPIRVLNFVFKLEIPYWVSVHLCRHIHAQPFVRSQRNDRQSDYDRNSAPQNAPVTMLWYMNAEELMTIANKRLCNQASLETRRVVQAMCDEVLKVCPEFEGLLVKMCQYGRCHEMYPCWRCEPNAENSN